MVTRNVATVSSKRRSTYFPLSVLEFEHVYLDNLPSSESYETSYMHRDIISHIAVTNKYASTVGIKSVRNQGVCVILHHSVSGVAVFIRSAHSNEHKL